jgi:glycosyltransferase involved in cell wall biosynthesis
MNFARLRSLRFSAVFKGFRELKDTVKSESIDLIHTDSTRQSVYAALVGRRMGIPVILHARVSDSGFFTDKALSALTDYVIAVSQTAAKRFKSGKDPGRLFVIYNGVELDSFSLSEIRPKDGPLKIGYFGQIERRKSIETVINAVRELKSEANLTITGDGDNGYIRELKSITKGMNVEFMPYKIDIREEIKDTDVVVMPAVKEEGLSRIIIECMAMGKTVIASDLSSNIEALGRDNMDFIFRRKDHAQLRDILSSIADDRDVLARKREMLRGRAERLFDIRKTTKAVENLYGRIPVKK